MHLYSLRNATFSFPMLLHVLEMQGSFPLCRQKLWDSKVGSPVDTFEEFYCGERYNKAVHGHGRNGGIEALKNVVIDGLGFTGSSGLQMWSPVFEQAPAAPRSHAVTNFVVQRNGAVFMENLENVRVQRCAFFNVLGNAIFLSGHSVDVSVTENYVHHVGVHGIVVAGKEIVEIDSHGALLNKGLEFSRATNVSNNVIHDIGTLYRQAAAVFVAAASQTLTYENLIYQYPEGGQDMVVTSARGTKQTANVHVPRLQPLILPPLVNAPTLGITYTQIFELGPRSTACLVKIVSTHSSTWAKVRTRRRLLSSNVTREYVPAEEAESWETAGTSTRVEVHDDVEIIMLASSSFQSTVHANLEVRHLFLDGGYETESWGYSGGQVVSATWRIRTRPCRPGSDTISVSCSGECGCDMAVDEGSPPCPPGGYIKNKLSKICTGPHAGWSGNCPGDVGPPRTIFYHDCDATCTRTWCD